MWYYEGGVGFVWSFDSKRSIVIVWYYDLKQDIAPMVVPPEKIDCRRFV